MLAQSSGDLKNECSSRPFTQYALVACIGATLCLPFASFLFCFTAPYVSALTVDGRMNDGGSGRMCQQIVIF